MTPTLSRSRMSANVGAPHLVPPLQISSANLCLPPERPRNANPSRHKRPPTVNLTPLEATLTRFAVPIATKGLTKTLSPLHATFTKKRGVQADTEAVRFES